MLLPPFICFLILVPVRTRIALCGKSHGFFGAKQYFYSDSSFFSIRRHSYMAADRVFERIGKDYWRMEDILTPIDYHKMLENHGTVQNLNKDWKITDLKSRAQKVLRLTLTFNMAPQRVITYSKTLGKHHNVSVTVQNTYTACPVAVWLLKRRIKTCGSVLNSPVLPEVNMVSKVKKRMTLRNSCSISK
ncbi:hypothetical protein ANN_27997 [Periplaneta americana]|uniref:Uncharacterized protein n=1 Tax=Periplaneta americana TaxID=6978 RepID=A0ABQ8RUJ8_PERAM|nr:hypothetical protein ANN_27997 [Periplaneta americana]